VAPKDDSILITALPNKIIQRIQLKKFGGGFLYNDLFQEEKLPEIDLLHPLLFLKE